MANGTGHDVVLVGNETDLDGGGSEKSRARVKVRHHQTARPMMMQRSRQNPSSTDFSIQQAESGVNTWALENALRDQGAGQTPRFRF